MIIAYIAFGIVSGLIAATFAFVSGSGIGMALVAYSLAGIAGMMMGLIWSSVPRYGRADKHIATQRS